ncbi:MAG TPA: hypothetical protein ACFYED_11965 [Candidatus Tripitaka californicus]|uniref:hypothetical protein n=1 Tax=Candidatus Tripitaka californicus TaxID=3367616 RepID=UPI004024B501|nr:hypothetical protein [Planctomycetota bacterium]
MANWLWLLLVRSWHKKILIIGGTFFIIVILDCCFSRHAKEVRAHKPKWQISQGFSTCDQVVNFLNVEQPHEFHVLTDSKGQYAVIYEE